MRWSDVDGLSGYNENHQESTEAKKHFLMFTLPLHNAACILVTQMSLRRLHTLLIWTGKFSSASKISIVFCGQWQTARTICKCQIIVLKTWFRSLTQKFVLPKHVCLHMGEENYCCLMLVVLILSCSVGYPVLVIMRNFWFDSTTKHVRQNRDKIWLKELKACSAMPRHKHLHTLNPFVRFNFNHSRKWRIIALRKNYQPSSPDNIQRQRQYATGKELCPLAPYSN